MTIRRNLERMMNACATEGLSKHTTACLVQAVLELDSIDNDLVSDIAYLERELTRAKRDIAGGSHVNSLGICQNTATRIDRGAALRDAKIAEVKRLVYMGAGTVHDDLDDVQAAAVTLKAAIFETEA